MHRFVLAEFNTHRVFSRNSASSRAIPFSKQVDRLVNHPALPTKWASKQRGMQGGDEIEDKSAAESAWLDARDAAIRHATSLDEMGVHKSIVNRLLEPFMWHTVIVTSTEWYNFFHQRVSPLAQPEIEATARRMQEAFDASEPVEVGYDEWHTPYILPEEDFDLETRKKVSAARCARVSYLTHDGTRDVSKDLELYERLVTARPGHWSPLEHVATPGFGAGNLRGWRQLRHFVDRPRLRDALEAKKERSAERRLQLVSDMFEKAFSVPFHGRVKGIEVREGTYNGDKVVQTKRFYVARHDDMTTDILIRSDKDALGEEVFVYTVDGDPIFTDGQLLQYVKE